MKFIPAGLQKLSIASVVFCSVLSVSQVKPATASNLVVNGSFEQTLLTGGTDINDGGWKTYDEILGWKATEGGKIEIQRGAAGMFQDGKQLTELIAITIQIRTKLAFFRILLPKLVVNIAYHFSIHRALIQKQRKITLLFCLVTYSTRLFPVVKVVRKHNGWSIRLILLPIVICLACYLTMMSRMILSIPTVLTSIMFA